MTRKYHVELLRDARVRRILAEMLAVMFLLFVALQFVVAPQLQAAFPGLFPELPGRYGRGSPPGTRLGWLELLLGVALSGAFFYYRLYRTELGESVKESVLEVMDISEELREEYRK